jgi:hypothetical protein
MSRLVNFPCTIKMRINSTANIQHRVACPEAEAAGRTVREALENVFAADDQALLRSSHRNRTADASRSFSEPQAKVGGLAFPSIPMSN